MFLTIFIIEHYFISFHMGSQEKFCWSPIVRVCNFKISNFTKKGMARLDIWLLLDRPIDA